MADDQDQQAQPQADLVNPQNLVSVKELETLFSNSKADIPIFYGEQIIDNVKAKFMCDQIKTVQTTYHWSEEATAGNFKLALRERLLIGLTTSRTQK
jgi:hypothetical protein